MQLEAYLERDDRIVLPLGCTEQHAYLSLATDSILAELVSVEAAQPLGIPVLPALPYGLTPTFAAFPGSPTLRLETLVSVVQDLLGSLHQQGFRRILLVNGHGGNDPVAGAVAEWAAARPDSQALFHSWWNAPRVREVVKAIDPDASHASWMENFAWTRLEGVELPRERKQPVDFHALRVADPKRTRELLGDGSFGGHYERAAEELERIWRAGVEEVRNLLENAWLPQADRA